MCTWFYADYKHLSGFINKAHQLTLTSAIMNAMSKPSTMSGNIRPTDMAAVLASNKQGNLGVFPMIWGFTHESMSKPLINCRIETAGQKPLWKDSWHRRRCIIPASWYYEWGFPPSEVGFSSNNIIYGFFDRCSFFNNTSYDTKQSRLATKQDGFFIYIAIIPRNLLFSPWAFSDA